MSGLTMLTDWLSGKKTTIVASSGFVAALAGWVNGMIDLDWALLVTFLSATSATLRAAIAKVQDDLNTIKAKGGVK